MKLDGFRNSSTDNLCSDVALLRMEQTLPRAPIWSTFNFIVDKPLGHRSAKVNLSTHMQTGKVKNPGDS